MYAVCDIFICNYLSVSDFLTLNAAVYCVCYTSIPLCYSYKFTIDLYEKSIVSIVLLYRAIASKKFSGLLSIVSIIFQISNLFLRNNFLQMT